MEKLKDACKTLIIVLFFSLFSFGQAQNQKIKIFYPLNTGNYWEYTEEPPFYKLYRKVLGDTLMPNGKEYKVIQETQEFASIYPPHHWESKFQRISSDFTVVYQYVHVDSIPSEEILFNLYVALGDTWPYPKNSIPVPGGPLYFKIDEITEEVVLGRQLHVIYINPWRGGGLADQSFAIADSLGIILQGFEVGYYKLTGAIINGVQYGITSVDRNSKEGDFLKEIQLSIHPNPFNGSTEIGYTLSKAQDIEISIYDLLGRRKATLVQGKMEKGRHSIFWKGVDQEGRALASGTYFCVLLGENFYETKKGCILR